MASLMASWAGQAIATAAAELEDEDDEEDDDDEEAAPAVLPAPEASIAPLPPALMMPQPRGGVVGAEQRQKDAAKARRDAALAGRLAQLQKSLFSAAEDARFRVLSPAPLEPLAALVAREGQPPVRHPEEASATALASMPTWLSPLFGPDENEPRTWKKGEWLWPSAFNTKADGLEALVVREGAATKRVGVAAAAAATRRATSERDADMDVYEGLRRKYLVRQGRRVEGMEAVLDMLEVERREALWARYMALRQLKFAKRAWRICERQHGRARCRLAGATRRLEAKERGGEVAAEAAAIFASSGTPKFDRRDDEASRMNAEIRRVEAEHHTAHVTRLQEKAASEKELASLTAEVERLRTGAASLERQLLLRRRRPAALEEDEEA
mmetsp:Transcript_60442/g.129638  ORF Transcript_60442/g.129638 Transcript_60442/m.129638 type:complete len:384 (+) Transcript_60442:67-1218(+)